jgi:hypothetical protein
VLLLHLHLLKGDPERLRFAEGGSRLSGRTGTPRIRCPVCAWEPQRDDRWSCSCDFIWNTFDTEGVCPACDYRWLETMCLRCRLWSKHHDWYIDDKPLK